MSKSPRQHWQEDNKKYTFQQYAFYLVFLGLVIVGLAIWYILLMWGEKTPVTHLVSITCQPGGNLPVIPFQNEDSDALDSSFENYQRFEFNDSASFEQKVINELTKKFEQSVQDIDTVIVWLSAIGDVENGQPVILGSDPDMAIELESLIGQLNELNAKSIILLLDCGHAYAAQNAYVDPGVESDFNRFPEAVLGQLENLGVGDKVHIVMNGLAGQRPMYSTTRRRSLLGNALEFCLGSQPVDEAWTPGKLESKLDDFSLRFGGTAAPNLKWLGSIPADLDFANPIVKSEGEEAEPDEEISDPDRVEVTPTASKIAQDTNKAWAAYRKARKEFAVLPPSVIDLDSWQKITRQLIELNADELQSVISLPEFMTACREIPRDIQRLKESLRDKSTRLIENLDLIPDPEAATEPKPVIEKRHVAKTYIQIHDLRNRLPYYIAVVDSLSWIFPSDGTIEDLGDYTTQLIELYGKTNNESEFASVLNDVSPSLDQFSGINAEAQRLVDAEARILRTLNSICRDVVLDCNGFQREMAVEALLRLPILEAEKPDESSPDFQDEDRLWSREELQEILSNNPVNTFPRVEPSDRDRGSALRMEIYRNYIKSIGDPTVDNPTSLRLQSFAYRLPVEWFPIDKLAVRERTPEIYVKATRHDDLVNGDNYIERTLTQLDLGLVVRNTEVLVRCEIIQGEKYFGFADNDNSATSEFMGNPSLVALRDAPAINPHCKLNISIVDRNNPSKEYENLTIPIRLPTEDSIEVIVEMGGSRWEFEQDSLGDPIRTFANRIDNCKISLRNNWHYKRTGTVSIFACASPHARTIVGKINEDVKQRTLQELNAGSLSAIASADFELPGAVAGEAIDIHNIKWNRPAGQEGDLPVISADNGFLCVIDHEKSGSCWYYWIPVFPFEKPVVGIIADVSSDDLTLMVSRKDFCPAENPVSLSWRFSDDQIRADRGVLSPGINKLELPAGSNVSEVLDKNSLLYIDVDDWPRKYIFEFNGRTFNPVSPNSAALTVRLGQMDDEPTETNQLVELRSSESSIEFGTRSSEQTVSVEFSPNVPSDGSAFSFASAEDYISLFENRNTNERLFYPRQISNFVQLDPKSGIMLESKVDDYRLTFSDTGPRFELNPTLNLAQQSINLSGQNRVSIQFDTRDPEISEIRVATTSPIFSNEKVRIRLDATDGKGVGIDWDNDVEIFLSDRNGTLRDLSGKPRPARRVDQSTFEIDAPNEPGTYTVGAKVADRVGNTDQSLAANRVKFEVVEKPSTPVKKPIEPKVYTHTLVVTVAPRNTELSNVTNLVVKMDPEPESPPETRGNKYFFRKLKADVSYTVSATCKLKSGPARGLELVGEIQHTFSKDADRSQTSPKTLIMKPN